MLNWTTRDTPMTSSISYWEIKMITWPLWDCALIINCLSWPSVCRIPNFNLYSFSNVLVRSSSGGYQVNSQFCSLTTCSACWGWHSCRPQKNISVLLKIFDSMTWWLLVLDPYMNYYTISFYALILYVILSYLWNVDCKIE